MENETRYNGLVFYQMMSFKIFKVGDSGLE